MGRTLYCEGCESPRGIDEARPELSWRLEGEYAPQKSWQARVWEAGTLLFDSGKRVGKALSWRIPEELESYKDYEWSLEWELEDGGQGEAHDVFSTGMLSGDQWEASWISGGTLLRKSFGVRGRIRCARVFFTGLGYCEGYLNGEKLTDRVLFPSYTVYEKTVEYTVADVTDQILQGENVMGLMLGGHWPLDEELRARDIYNQAFYRGRCCGIAQLKLWYEDGREETVATDRTWRTSASPVTMSSVFDGEHYDARMEQPGWSGPGFDDRGWGEAVLSREPLGTLKYSYLPPIRVIGTMPVKKLWKQGEAWMADFGQNFTGWVRLELSEERGTKIRIRQGEVLYEDGSLNTENLRAAKATDEYICKGGGECWEPRFTYHGFRYVEITGIEGELKPDKVWGRRVHTDNQVIGEFSCSEELFNRIYDAMCWTMRSNMHSIPTDCCQRDERQGWMADAGVSSEFGVMNFDLAGFYRKWFGDIRDTQEREGNLPLAGAPGWPRDTFIWKIGYHMALRSLYLYSGNIRAVSENYPALQRYEEYLHGTLKNGLLAYDFYNDWLAIEFANNLMIANAFLVDFYEAMILFAGVLEDEEGRKRYEKRQEALKDAVNREFYGRCMDHPKGTGYYGTCDTLAVAPSALALQFNIAPEEWQEKIIWEMVFQVRESRGSTQYPTGILTSGILNQCLSDLGYDELVWEFFKREDYPSLGFMLSKGATTIWERWQYLVHNEMNSHNHPALCSLGTWFFKGLLGLRKVTPQKEGGAAVELSPYIPEEMERAGGKIRTVWGTVSLRWEREKGGAWYHMEIPGGVTALLRMGEKEINYPGGHHRVWIPS